MHFFLFFLFIRNDPSGIDSCSQSSRIKKNRALTGGLSFVRERRYRLAGKRINRHLNPYRTELVKVYWSR